MTRRYAPGLQVVYFYLRADGNDRIPFLNELVGTYRSRRIDFVVGGVFENRVARGHHRRIVRNLGTTRFAPPDSLRSFGESDNRMTEAEGTLGGDRDGLCRRRQGQRYRRKARAIGNRNHFGPAGRTARQSASVGAEEYARAAGGVRAFGVARCETHSKRYGQSRSVSAGLIIPVGDCQVRCRISDYNPPALCPAVARSNGKVTETRRVASGHSEHARLGVSDRGIRNSKIPSASGSSFIGVENRRSQRATSCSL